MIAIFITINLIYGKVLHNDLILFIKVLESKYDKKKRVGAADAATNAEDQAVAISFGSRFPVVFELLDPHAFLSSGTR